MVSIIIATYNAESVVETALKSVCNQNFSDWECIVVDGLSKDNTLGIVTPPENGFIILVLMTNCYLMLSENFLCITMMIMTLFMAIFSASSLKNG